MEDRRMKWKTYVLTEIKEEHGESLIGEDPGKIHGSHKIRGHVMSVTII